MAGFEYPDDLWKEARSRYAKMIELANAHSTSQDTVVVDLGSGNHPVSVHVRCRTAIKIDSRLNIRPDVVCELNRGIPLRDGVCDIVIAGELLEHIYYSKKFLMEIKRILRNGGYLLLSVPNVCSLSYRILWALGRVPPLAAKADFTYSPPGRGDGHVRDYTFKELGNVLKSLDFDVLRSTTNGIFYRRLSVPSTLIPKTFGQKIIVLARNKKG